MSKQANSTIQPSKRHGKLQTVWNWLRENGPVLVAVLAVGGTLNYSQGINFDLQRKDFEVLRKDFEVLGKDFEILRTEMNAGFQLVDLRFQAVEANIDEIEVDIKDIKQDIGVLQRDVSVLQQDVRQIKGSLAVSPDDEPHFAESDADP